MLQLPGALFIIDPKREHLAIHEAKRLHIPIIAITDTNCDPDRFDFVIAANDDAIRSVRLISAGIADAAIQGRMRAEATSADRELTCRRPTRSSNPRWSPSEISFRKSLRHRRRQPLQRPNRQWSQLPLQQKTQSKPGAFGIVRRSTLIAEYDRGVR